MLEWAGMARHWQYRLDEKCVNLEPNNALILVKQAGVCMDRSMQKEAMKSIEMALELDSPCDDALWH